MMRCLRIFGAYSYRITRKHSTILLVASFIAIITVILHLYSYRSQSNLNLLPRFGEYYYRPGSFLRGIQPSNVSHCEFNYGLPYTLKWDEASVLSPPETGSKSAYRVIYNAVRGTAFDNYTRMNAVTYATQATPEFIFHILEIARHWDGPISLSVFVPSYDLDITMQIMTQLCHCYSGMDKVSLHLFFPKNYPPVIQGKEGKTRSTTEISTSTSNITIEDILRKKFEDYKKLNNKTRPEYIMRARQKKIERMMTGYNNGRRELVPELTFEDCSGEESVEIPTFRRQKSMIYPINVGRNVARNASGTNYFIVSDIEMVPSEGLAPKFLTMVRKLMGDKKRDEGCVFLKTVFVVPLFEVERGEAIPRDKDMLLRLVAANRATYFHQKVCPHCQRFPGLQSWLSKPSPSGVEPMLIARREYPYHRWEPLYFGTRKDPWYSEALSWEGRQDKMTQMLELCLQEYRMVVLDGAFLCHAAAPKTQTKQSRAEFLNAQRYLIITEQLKKKYPKRPQCKISWRC